jgi:hypothetical protein
MSCQVTCDICGKPFRWEAHTVVIAHGEMRERYGRFVLGHTPYSVTMCLSCGHTLEQLVARLRIERGNRKQWSRKPQ